LKKNSTVFGNLDQLESDPCDAPPVNAKFPGTGKGEVHLAAVLIRSAVVDAHELVPPGPGIYNANQGAKWKGRMRRSKGLAVINLAIRGLPTLEPRSIPTRQARPDLHRFYGLTGMGDQRGLNPRCYEKHE
jgi:hypothetical protein